MSPCIVILEDHPLYAAGLKEVAEQLLPGSNVICESTLESGVNAIRRNGPSLIISDLHVPGSQGTQTLRTLRVHAPDTLLIGITGDIALLNQTSQLSDPDTVVLGKTESVDRVFDSILTQMKLRGQAANECPAPSSRSNVWSLRPPEQVLTRKQQAVLSLMGQGLSNKEIARKLQISPETVKSHAKSLYRQLGVKNRTQAAGRIRRMART